MAKMKMSEMETIACAQCGADGATPTASTWLERLDFSQRAGAMYHCPSCDSRFRAPLEGEASNRSIWPIVVLCAALLIGAIWAVDFFSAPSTQAVTSKEPQIEVDKPSPLPAKEVEPAAAKPVAVGSAVVSPAPVTVQDDELDEEKQRKIKQNVDQLQQTEKMIATQRAAIERSEAMQREVAETMRQLKGELAGTAQQLELNRAKVDQLTQQEQALLNKIDAAAQEKARVMRTGDMRDQPNASELTQQSSQAAQANQAGTEGGAALTYTIQLASFRNVEQLKKFVDVWTSSLSQPLYYPRPNAQAQAQSGSWLPVYYGQFASRDQAQQQLTLLPDALKASTPLVRDIDSRLQTLVFSN